MTEGCGNDGTTSLRDTKCRSNLPNSGCTQGAAIVWEIASSRSLSRRRPGFLAMTEDRETPSLSLGTPALEIQTYRQTSDLEKMPVIPRLDRAIQNSRPAR